MIRARSIEPNEQFGVHVDSGERGRAAIIHGHPEDSEIHQHAGGEPDGKIP